MKNIHLLTTHNPSRLHYSKVQSEEGIPYKLMLNQEESKCDNGLLSGQRHIYITSDENLKEGDWFLPKGHINPHKLKGFNNISGDLESYNGLCYDISKCKKIILTTDQDLIQNGVQAIDDEFLEWFVKNPSCEYVETKRIEDGKYVDRFPDGSVIEGIYENYKIIIPQEEPKQETLEEVAINCWAEGAWDNRDDFTDGFVEGAKWQAERMYSAEEVKLAYNEGQVSIISANYIRTEEWFEQFKKK